MTDRETAIARAALWAEAADTHAEYFTKQLRPTYPKEAEYHRKQRNDRRELAAMERDQAHQMALMWATIAALHPAEPKPSGRDFFANSAGFTDILGLHAEGLAAAARTEPMDHTRHTRCPELFGTDDGEIQCALDAEHSGLHSTGANPMPHFGCPAWDLGKWHSGHTWAPAGSARAFQCSGVPRPCAYCGCTADPANCVCDHDGTGSTASELEQLRRVVERTRHEMGLHTGYVNPLRVVALLDPAQSFDDPEDEAGPCTATITPPGNLVGGGITWGCALTAGHYVDDFDAKDGPHRNLLEPNDSDVSLAWSDWAEGAVPHGAAPEGSSGTDPS